MKTQTRHTDKTFFAVVKEVSSLVTQLEATVDAISELLVALREREGEDAGDPEAD